MNRRATEVSSNSTLLAITIAVFCTVLGQRDLAAQQSYQVPEDLYLRFDEGSGSTVENFAVPGVGSRFLSSVPGWFASGSPSGSACQPNPTSPQNVVATNQPFSLSGSWTIEFMAYLDPNGSLGLGSLFGEPSGSINATVTPWLFSFGLQMIVQFVDVTGVSILAGVQTTVSGWHHVAFVYDDPSLTLTTYLDGSSTTTVSTTQSLSFSGTSSLGFCVGGNGITAPTNMPFDEFRFWRRPRSAAEIAANAFSSLAAPFVGEIRFGPNGLTSTFNATSGTFSASGAVSELILPGNGSVTTSSDPIIGATVTMSGAYTGSDLITYSDISLFVSNLQIAAGSGDALTVQGAFSASSGPASYFELAGQFGAQPLRRRVLGTPITPILTLSGNGSPIMGATLLSTSGGAPTSLILRDFGQGLRIAALGIDFQPPTIPPTINANSNGAGAFFLGAVGLPAGSFLVNLFAVSPGNPVVGQGPFFGIVFGADQFAQLSLPIGVAPFKVLPDVEGNYLFGVPPGTIAPGLVVDHVGIVVQPTTMTVASPAKRLTF